MAPEHVLDRFEQLLDEERSALRQLDSARIDQFAAEKAALMEALQHGLRDRPDLTPRFRDVAAGLRRNAVLLAHARDCLRDVLATFHDVPGARPISPPPSRLSLRG
mgnify:CR=1 FL=1